ncbi:MAG: hypothetical protein Q8K83_01565 [Methylotenera sp.]|nr:hypothetical protein [Methylotenera sp.]
MYKEIALDPACMAEMEYYNLLRQHFGFNHGRYISADIKAWVLEAMRHVKASSLQPIKQQTIKNYLNKIFRAKVGEEFHLTEDRKAIKAEVWSDWWSQQEQLRKFSLTISENTKMPCIKMADINEKHTDWIIPTSISIDGNSQEILKVLMPLCSLSNAITIIDPYFRLADNNVLTGLFSCLQNTNVDSLTIVSTISPDKPSENYDRLYKNLNTKNITFRWIFAPDKFFHDRYFLTDIGAIRSGNGFAEQTQKGAHADKLNLNIIDQEEAVRTDFELRKLLTENKGTVIFSV